MSNDVKKTHQYSSRHRKYVLQSETCGCFYCFALFPPSEIVEWVDDDDSGVGQTALCPSCGIDAVLPDSAARPLNSEFLQRMHEYWFKQTIRLPH
jgi:hypothetical protein